MLRNDQLDILLQPYGLKAEQTQFLGFSQNHVYSGQFADKKCIIRISQGRHRTRQQIEAELSWLTFLAEQGIKACQPLPAKSGALCQQVEIADDTFLVTCFEHAPGNRITKNDLTPSLYEKLGRLLGQMHSASITFHESRPALPRPQWFESRLLQEDFIEKASCLSAKFHTSVSELIQHLNKPPVTPLNHGLLHGDVSFGNCFLHEGELSIFDFDNCEYGYFLQDIATVLYDSIYCKVLNRFADAGLTQRMLPFWAAFVTGYRHTGPLLEISQPALKQFFLLREAIIYVHYHRILDISRVNESFKAGLEVMRQNVETQTHQVDFDRITSAVPH